MLQPKYVGFRMWRAQRVVRYVPMVLEWIEKRLQDPAWNENVSENKRSRVWMCGCRCGEVVVERVADRSKSRVEKRAEVHQIRSDLEAGALSQHHVKIRDLPRARARAPTPTSLSRA